MLRHGAGWMAAGLTVGAAGTVLIVRLLEELLYGVSPFDLVATRIPRECTALYTAILSSSPPRRLPSVDAGAEPSRTVLTQSVFATIMTDRRSLNSLTVDSADIPSCGVLER